MLDSMAVITAAASVIIVIMCVRKREGVEGRETRREGERGSVVPTCRWWDRVRRCRCRKRSQSGQRSPQTEQCMMASVSLSS